MKKAKSLESRLMLFETMIPWLSDLTYCSLQDTYEAINVITEDETEYEQLHKWLSPEEYNKLSNQEKYQIALDRWIKRKRSSWEAGIDFERYVGYQYEQNGYRVTYVGALMGLKDLGRDLIAKKDGQVLIIQCKRWREGKTIHEKHIFNYTEVLLPTKSIIRKKI